MRINVVRMNLVLGLLACFSLPLPSSFGNTPAEDTHAKLGSSNRAANNRKIAASEKSSDMTREQMITHLREANEVAKESRKFGRHPFGAVLVAPDNQRVLMHQGNINIMRHAEVEISRRAAENYSPEYLTNCTLVTTFEPCVMCSGNIYFANIGNVVFGATEETLAKLTGASKVNPTMHLPCRKVFEAGQKTIRVNGPFPDLQDEIMETHKGFW